MTVCLTLKDYVFFGKLNDPQYFGFKQNENI